MSDKKTHTIEQDAEFARRRRALLKKTGKLAVAAPAVTLLMSGATGSKYAMAGSPVITTW